MSRDFRFLLVLGCFVLSGVAGLIYQTAWSQQFAFVFGTSELAVATVLAAYMAGLMAGAHLSGIFLHRLKRPLLTYSLLELGIAVSALAVPFGLEIAQKVQATWLADSALGGGASETGSAFFYLISAFLILFLPTALMGATLPILARHAVHEDRQIGLRIGLLYGANTAGAAAGTLVAAFVFLPWLGLGLTVWIAVGLNAVVFVLALALERQPTDRAIARKDEDEALLEPTVSLRPARSGRWILPVILVSGIVSFCWEVLWTRLLSHLLGGSIYAFGVMLATFLVGIAIGSTVASRWANSAERARAGFAFCQLAIALSSLGAFLMVERLPVWLGDPAGKLLHASLASAATLLPGALFIGATFPFAVRILTERASETGQSSARVYAWNTFGAILGAVGAGFFLLPALEIDGTARAAVATSALLALISASIRRPRRHVVLVGSTLVLLAMALFPPPTPWNVLRSSPLSGRMVEGEVAFFSVGRSSTVLVSEQPGLWRLTTNGLPESAIAPKGAREGAFSIARWLSMLPVLSRPDLKSMLIIGLGAGITAAAVPDSVDEVHVVELEPEVVKANQTLADLRQKDPLSDPRLSLHINDARSALNLSRRTFDAIVSQPSHPWTAGASHLFTREFFELVHSRLEPSGVFVQWIGLRFLDEDLLRSLLATLNAVFPYVEVFQPPPGGALLFLAGDEPLAGPEDFERGFAAARDPWWLLGHPSAHSVLAARRLDARASRAFGADAPISRDLRNLFRTRSAKAMRAPLERISADQLLANGDPLVAQARAGRLDQPLFYVRTLIQQGSLRRAGAVADALVDDTARRTAQALLLIHHQRRPQGKRALFQILRARPDAEEALGTLMLMEGQALIQGQRPAIADLVEQFGGDAATVNEAWRRSALGDRAGLRNLEPALASIASGSIFFRPATQLRIRWRESSGQPSLAAEGLHLLDGLLAMENRPGLKLLHRARLAAVAQDSHSVRASYQELLRSKPKPKTARAVLKALRQTDPGLRPAIDYNSLEIAFSSMASNNADP